MASISLRLRVLIQRCQEAHAATITLEEDDPETVRRMLTYLYTLDYDDGIVARASDDKLEHVNEIEGTMASQASMTLTLMAEAVSRMMADVLVYSIADKYNISELKELAISKFENLSEGTNIEHRFTTVADAVYTTTPGTDSGLRELVTQQCEANITEIAESEALFRMFQNHGNLGQEVLIRTLDGHKDEMECAHAQIQYANAESDKQGADLKRQGADLEKRKQDIIVLQRRLNTMKNDLAHIINQMREDQNTKVLRNPLEHFRQRLEATRTKIDSIV